MWHVSRDESAGKDSTSLVLVAADYELFDDAGAAELAAAILDVANRQAYYIAQGGTRYLTKAEYDAQP